MSNDQHPHDTTGPAAADAPLPHDRDEHPQAPVENAQHRENRKPIEQGRRDTDSGIVDTERIGTPNDVPSSGGKDRPGT